MSESNRTAPVSAPLDTQALPSLPPHIEVGGEGWGLEDFQSWKTFTVDDMEQYARSAIAPYAARIAHLERELKQAKLHQLADLGQDIERELAERKPVSIDTPEFRRLLGVVAYGNHHTAISALIAYIDGRTAGTAPEGFVLVPAEPTPDMVEAAFIGVIEDQSISGQVRRREAMARKYRAMIAAAPSPQSKQEEAE